jgi:hypothetical protein
MTAPKTSPALLEAHKALHDAIKHLEEVSGATIAQIFLEDGDMLIAADFDTEAEAMAFVSMTKGGN